MDYQLQDKKVIMRFGREKVELNGGKWFESHVRKSNLRFKKHSLQKNVFSALRCVFKSLHGLVSYA